MTTNLVEWAPEIEPWIPGVPMPAIMNAVREAARQFCEETLLWTTTLTAISVVADQQDYTLTVDPTLYGEIVGIDVVKFKITGAANDQYRTLDPVAEPSEDVHNSGNWKWAEGAQPTHYGVAMSAVTTLSLYPIPTVAATSGLLVSVNLMPTIAALVLPDFLYNTYRQAIAKGAKAILQDQDAMPWANPQKSLKNEGQFRRRTNSAKLAKFTGATKRPLKVKLRAFV